MKRIALAAFAAFWAFVAAVLTLSALVPERAVGPAARSITLAQVAEHAGAESCWLAIEGRVYDVTAYLASHPAPPAVLLAWCGREATEGMRTKGYGRDHSAAAWASLETMYIGDLEERAPGSP